MWHDLTLATIIALVTLDGCTGLTCYYCTIHPPSGHSNKTTQLCSLFDYSNHYHIDCPYSTFCMKRTFELTLQQGRKVEVSERGCAPQKWNDQVFKNGSWQLVKKIEGDVYSIGCQQDEGSGLRSPTQYCYCETNLCNTAVKLHDHFNTLAVIFIFHIIKYIRGLR